MSDSQVLTRRSKLSASDVAAQKGSSPLVMLALYDLHLGRIAEAAAIDMILVGDSLGMAVLGLTSTTQVTTVSFIRVLV